MAQTVRSIYTSEGLVGFWHGNLAACVRVVPHKADMFRALDDSGRNQLPNVELSLSGSLAGFTASTVTYPLDLIGTRVSGKIGDNLVYTGIISTFTRTRKEEGQRALFRGIGPTLFGALSHERIKFRSYDLLSASYQMRCTQK
ncbi:hypothetical protein PsorP6_008220 [Peronosclerospora sorghi]|uniref:Uncharacterized protein n=1 Tax=Peronosclerospora sorghi TaxID=230839 RepID=A0ACC0WC84_9STRA|nr:hypothetical protein PsorP6_008220 [Peronosclerospora sorghi]